MMEEYAGPFPADVMPRSITPIRAPSCFESWISNILKRSYPVIPKLLTNQSLGGKISKYAEEQKDI